MPLDQNPHQTVTHFVYVGLSMYACGLGYCVPNATILLLIKMSFIWIDDFFFFAKIGIFCNSIAALLSEAKTHWMVNWPEPINVCISSYQGHYAKFISMMSPKCSIVESDGELMLMALHSYFLPQQQYSREYVMFLAFHALVYWWGCQFLSLSLQDNGASLLPKCVHVLQHYFENHITWKILPSVV